MTTIKGKWTLVQKHELLQRSSQTLSALPPDTVCIFGGELIPREPRDNMVHILSLKPYSPSRKYRASLHHYGDEHSIDTTDDADLPSARVGTASTVVEGKVYYFSGRGGVDMAPVDEGGKLWQFHYDADGIGWDLISPADPSLPVPEPRSYHCMTCDKTSTIYVHAGCPTSGRLSDLWSFNVVDRKWTRLASAPGAPRGGTSMTFSDGKLYRMGGFDGNLEMGGEIDMYDIATNTWSTHTFTPDGINAPGARSVATLFALPIHDKSSLITAFGESDPSALGHAGAGNMLPDTWVYEIETKEWRKVEVDHGKQVPRSRGWFAADVVTFEDKEGVIVQGGLAEDNERLDDAWVLSF